MALWADRSAPHSNAPSSKLRNHAEIVECIRGKLFWGVRVGRVGLLEDYSEGVCVGRVGLLGRPGAGACPNLPQRRFGLGSAANETAEYQRFSSGVPARWGPLWQIWTTGAAAGPVGRASPASARSMTSTLARTPARRTVADRASAPFDRASPTRAPPRTPRRRPNPRDRHLTHENVPLADDLEGYPTISRTATPPPAAPHHRPPNNLRGAELNDPPSAPKPGAGRTGARGPGGEGGREPSRVLGCVPLSPGAARSGSNPGPGPPPTSSPSASA